MQFAALGERTETMRREAAVVQRLSSRLCLPIANVSSRVG